MNVKLIKLTREYKNELGEIIDEDGEVEQRYWITL